MSDLLMKIRDTAGNGPALACAALILEAPIGYPGLVFDRISHPVVWMGRGLGQLEILLNRPGWTFGQRRAAGSMALLALLAVTVFFAIPFSLITDHWPGFVLSSIVAASLPAQRSLDTHVRAVADALEQQGLKGGREAVSMIVGRNPQHLDEAGVARAAIESLAENFSDGVVAPAFWIAVGGVAGGALYKAINTADSMIGHKTDRYLAFGWAAARIDDLVNLPASRLSALWLAVASIFTGAHPGDAVRAVFRDARRHRSPNAGWPEAAMAGALGLQLAGPRVYGETLVEDAYMGDGRRQVGAGDIRNALRLYRAGCLVQLAVLLCFAVWL